MNKLRKALLAMQGAINDALEAMQEQEPNPVPEPTPEPTPTEPEPGNIHLAQLANNTDPQFWDRGVKRNGAAVQIRNSDSNRQAFPKGAQVYLSDGEPRTVTWQEVSGGFINLHLDGGKLDAGAVGYPGMVSSGEFEPPAQVNPEPTPTEPTEPEPEPDPAPEQGSGHTARFNDYNSGGWNAGVMKAQDGWAVSIKNSDENRAAFPSGTTVVIGGKLYQVYWPQVVGPDISVHVRGPDIGEHDGTIAVFSEDQAYPTPETPTDPERPERDAGFEMQYLGINLAGHEFGKGTPYYHWPVEADFTLWKAEGHNAVRLPMGWERLQKSMFGPLESSEIVELNKVLNLAQKHGFKVLTDLHNYLRYGSAVIGKDAPAGALVDFWEKFADATKGHAALWAHGLMNEPYSKQPQWPGIAKACYDAIQKIDPKRLVVIAGDHWSNAHGWEGKNPDLPIANAPYAAYEFHVYPDVDASGSFKDRGENIQPDAITKRYADVRKWALEHNVMLVCGEINLAWDMKTPSGGSEPYGSEAIRRGLKQMIDDKVPVFWWSGGSRWTRSAPNATQFKQELRFPIQILREFKGKTGRMIGPIKQ